MHGGRTLLRMQLQKEQQELERKREEEESRRIRENVVGNFSSQSLSIPQKSQAPTVTVEVPPAILEVATPISGLLFFRASFV